MIHRFGDPFVGEILEQKVDERNGSVVRHETALSVVCFEPGDLRRRVDQRFGVRAVIAREDQTGMTGTDPGGNVSSAES